MLVIVDCIAACSSASESNPSGNQVSDKGRPDSGIDTGTDSATVDASVADRAVADGAHVDAPFDSASEKLVEASGNDGGTDANQTCRSLDALCSRDGGANVCVRTWQAAQPPSAYCQSPFAVIFLFPNCHGFNIVWDDQINFPVAYFYDLTSSELVGVVFFGSTPTCYGRPGTVVGIPLECLEGGPAVSICKADAH